MPCYDPRDSSGFQQDEIENLCKEINALTSMLCGVCKLMEKNNIEIEDKKTAEWWKQHKKWDAERENT